jgi:hypothetical protein
MSKTSQRKLSAYQLGRQDRLSGYGFRWSRYRFMAQYRAGFDMRQQPTILERIRRRFWTYGGPADSVGVSVRR